MSNSIGKRFVIATFGESHGPAIGAIVDGCPSGIALDEAVIQKQMDRRRPGQSNLTTARVEADKITILSGLRDGITLGTPIGMTLANTDCRPDDYEDVGKVARPSHADYTYRVKYGEVAASGGGRASARETATRVAAGTVADEFLKQRFGVDIIAWVSSIGDVDCPDVSEAALTRSEVDATPVRCPDMSAAEKMITLVENAAKMGDSVGGIVTCVCRNVPAGWGDPIFDKLNALLGRGLLSIPAVRGVEFGAGFSATRMRGSQHNDMFVLKGDRIGTVTNRSGGIQGGISNGEPIVVRVAFKPTASIATTQATVDYDGLPVTFQLQGRHDPCVLPRAVPVVEAMAAIVLADLAVGM
ncbi:MAG: chorismate synthase [Lentisphaerales bacterium]|jgi:chorismate synthase|nr:MAG: chorismate synthase [Lentisphaerales bacterium]